MGIAVLWVLGAVLAGAIAADKGRFGPAWFALALLVSPLVIFLLLIVIPPAPRPDRATKSRQPPWWIKRTTVRIERPAVFEPEGLLAGIPWRHGRHGTVEALIQGGTVRFADMERFVAAVGVEPAAGAPAVRTPAASDASRRDPPLSPAPGGRSWLRRRALPQ